MFYFPYLCTRLTPTKIWQNKKFQYPTHHISSTNKQNAKGSWRNFVPTTTRSRSSKWHQPKWSRSPLAWHTMPSAAVHSQKRKHLSSPKWSSTPSSSSTSEPHQPIIVHKTILNKTPNKTNLSTHLRHTRMYSSRHYHRPLVFDTIFRPLIIAKSFRCFLW